MNQTEIEMFPRPLWGRVIGVVAGVVGLATLISALAAWTPSKTTIEYLMVPAVVLLVIGGVLTSRRFLRWEEPGQQVRFTQWVYGVRTDNRVLCLTAPLNLVVESHERRKPSRQLHTLVLFTDKGRVILGSSSHGPTARNECDNVRHWLAPQTIH